MGHFLHVCLKRGLLFAFISWIMLSVSCGREEKPREIGIDGYVYVARELSELAAQSSEEMAGQSWERKEWKEIADLLEAAEGLSGLNLLFPSGTYWDKRMGWVYPAAGAKETVAVDGKGNSYGLSVNYTVDGSGALNFMDSRDTYCTYQFFPDGSIQVSPFGKESYLIEDPQEYADARALIRVTFTKKLLKGEKIYDLDLTDLLWGINPAGKVFAVLGGEKPVFLCGDRILVLDENGNLLDRIYVGQDQEEGYEKRYLTDGRNGSVSYVVVDSQGVEFYRLEEGDGGFLLTGEEKLEGQKEGSQFAGHSLYRGLKGSLFACDDGILYEYLESAGLKPLLKWEDSNFYAPYVYDVAQLSEEILLVDVCSASYEHGLYVLKRTKAEEMPEKEQILLASLWPFPELERAVADFNMESGEYHVILEQYGGGEDDTYAMARLDSALAGNDVPDLLDLTYLDFYKYTGKGAVEDLTGYLERSDRIQKEDLLENVAEGYTLEGELFCLPKEFYFRTLLVRTKQLEAFFGQERVQFQEVFSWTMEECMKFVEAYPEWGVLNSGQSAQWLLSMLCREYCLEHFVDWEGKSSSFDSDEFAGLLTWLKKCGEREGTGGRDASLLIMDAPDNFLQCLRMAANLGDELTLVGFPTADGELKFQPIVTGILGMVSESAHKEGAWAFLEFFLSREDSTKDVFFSTLRDDFKTDVEYYTTPAYQLDAEGNIQVFSDGHRNMLAKFTLGDESIPYLEKEQIADVLQAIESLDFTPVREEEDAVMEIVEEEAQDYFDGSKGIEEVADIIQGRVRLLLHEK